jgi:hypothetical protein
MERELNSGETEREREIASSISTKVRRVEKVGFSKRHD